MLKIPINSCHTMELFYETEAVNSAQVIYSSALFKCVRFTAFARFALCRTVRNRQNNGRKTKFVSLGRSRGSLFRRFAPYTQTKKALKNAVFQCFFVPFFTLLHNFQRGGTQFATQFCVTPRFLYLFTVSQSITYLADR